MSRPFPSILWNSQKPESMFHLQWHPLREFSISFKSKKEELTTESLNIISIISKESSVVYAQDIPKWVSSKVPTIQLTEHAVEAISFR